MPLTAKPAGSFTEWTSTGGTVGAALRCFDPLLPNGPARDVVGRVLGRPAFGSNGHGTGHAPVRIPNGFVSGAYSAASYRFTSGTTSLIYPDRGWTTSNIPSTHTIFCLIKPEAAAGPVARNVTVFGNGSMIVGQWIGYQVATNGTITLGRYTNSNTNFNNVLFSSASITLTSGKWYLIAMTNTTTTSSIWQVYNFTDAAYVTTQATGNSVMHTAIATPGTGATAGPDAAVNPGVGYNSYEQDCFLGEVACFGLSEVTWSPVTNSFFADMVDDPFRAARTADAGGGALTASGVLTWDATTGGIHLRSNMPTGGVAGSKQVRWHRSSTPSFTPSESTRLTTLGDHWEHEDTTAAPGRNYWYKSEQFDGTSTVYSTSSSTGSTQTSGRLSKGDLFFGLSSDSRWSNTQGRHISPMVCQMLRAAGFRAGVRNCGLASSRIRHASDVTLSWQPNTTQDPVNGQAGTTLLENLLSWCDLEGFEWIVSASGITDANDTAAATIVGHLQTILDYLHSQGKSTLLLRPFTSLAGETRTLNAHNLQAELEALDNGRTVRVAGSNNYDMSVSAPQAQQIDLIHLMHGHTEASSAYDAILAAFYPERPHPVGSAWPMTMAP
jgi:hypothetical protein